MLEGQSGVAFTPGDSPVPVLPSDRAARQSFHLGGLSEAQRVRLWRQLTPEPMPHALRDWQLLPADLRATAQVAPAGAPAALHVAGAFCTASRASCSPLCRCLTTGTISS